MAALPAGSLVSGPQLGWRPAIGNALAGGGGGGELLLSAQENDGGRFYASAILPLPFHCLTVDLQAEGFKSTVNLRLSASTAEL
jgi:hypothetical protein